MDRLEAQKHQQVRHNEASGSDGYRTEGLASRQGPNDKLQFEKRGACQPWGAPQG